MDWFGRLCTRASPKSLKHEKLVQSTFGMLNYTKNRAKFENLVRLSHVDELGQGDIPRFATAVSETPEPPNLRRDFFFPHA